MDIQLKALIVEDVATEAELAVRELRQSGIYLDTHIVQNEAAGRFVFVVEAGGNGIGDVA